MNPIPVCALLLLLGQVDRSDPNQGKTDPNADYSDELPRSTPLSPEESLKTLQVLEGFRIALDDMGVAYGSLEAIMELSPDYIKADLSLVRSVDTDPPRQELLRGLHSVALKLNAQIIAEGIETSEELAGVEVFDDLAAVAESLLERRQAS